MLELIKSCFFHKMIEYPKSLKNMINKFNRSKLNFSVCVSISTPDVDIVSRVRSLVKLFLNDIYN